MATYNGHKNWTYWNVALWLFNDEGLYAIVKDACRNAQSKDAAARQILASVPEKTPDGARYSLSAIRAAIVGEV